MAESSTSAGHSGGRAPAIRWFQGAKIHALLFFFSSRRRHTRWNCDWSSDVCSSDLPEEIFMVEVDARDDREDRRQNVGGVEAAAQANFDNPEFNAFAREAFERHGGNAFEIRGVSAKPVPTEKLLDELQQASKNSSKGFIFDFPAIEAHALVDSLEMRGGIQPGAKARMPKNRFQK